MCVYMRVWCMHAVYRDCIMYVHKAYVSVHVVCIFVYYRHMCEWLCTFLFIYMHVYMYVYEWGTLYFYGLYVSCLDLYMCILFVYICVCVVYVHVFSAA